jgi:hypothetical protein
MFRAYPAHLQEVYVVIVYTSMQPLVSSLSAGDCLVHRLRKNSFLTGAQDSHLQRVTIPRLHIYRVSEKDCTLFNFYPVCGEWCKLH